MFSAKKLKNLHLLSVSVRYPVIGWCKLQLFTYLLPFNVLTETFQHVKKNMGDGLPDEPLQESIVTDFNPARRTNVLGPRELVDIFW